MPEIISRKERKGHIWDRHGLEWIPRANFHSRQLVIAKFKWKSHYAYAVAKRYLRGKNIVTFEGARTVRNKMQAHFVKRNIYVDDYEHVLSFHIGRKDRYNDGSYETIVFVDGARRYINYSELPGIQSKLRKAKTLGEWDVPHVLQRLERMLFERRVRQHRRLDALTKQFKCLLRSPHHTRSGKASHILEVFSERI